MRFGGVSRSLKVQSLSTFGTTRGLRDIHRLGRLDRLEQDELIKELSAYTCLIEK